MFVTGVQTCALPILRDEALRLTYAGQTVAYRAYSCREGAYLPTVQLPAQPLVIL